MPDFSSRYPLHSARYPICLTLVSLLVCTTVRAGDAPQFDRDVAPILATRCLDCHSGTDPKGGLDLSSKNAAFRGGKTGVVIVAGNVDESPLWDSVSEGTMPPKTKLTDREKQALHDWIQTGAKWGTDPIDPYERTTERRAGRDWWAFQKIKKNQQASKQSFIDVLVEQERAKAGLKGAEPADRRTWIRRLTFDLTGLPPTPEEVAQFLADNRDDAYERLVDRLLASPQYGVRWARPWLDLARYGESNGFEYDEFRPWAWPYRDWVVNALNRDMPYDEFARMQIAGDVLKPGAIEGVEATGFLVAGAYDTPGQNQISVIMRKAVREDEMEDIVSTVGQTFLGLTIHCARCHDHKFDPITQRDYYALTASLAGVRHGERDLTSLDTEVIAAKRRQDEIRHAIAEVERPARAKILGKKKADGKHAPAPLLAWNFDRPEQPSDLKLDGGAKLQPEGLKVDGKAAYGFVGTIPKDLRAKTLEAWVRLDQLDQRGGGVISIQMPDGGKFDAIVFGENEAGHWMAGSEGFVRTQPFKATRDTEANKRPVHIAITYAADGTITGYRDGKPYGTAYHSNGPAEFIASKAHIIFGLRHGPVGGNRMLAGTITRARVYDYALNADEVRASFESAGEYISAERLDRELTDSQKAERATLRNENDELGAKIAGHSHKAYAVSPRTPEDVHRLIRGNPAQPAELMRPAGLSAVAHPTPDFGLAANAPEDRRRVALAAWLTSPENPLFARVIVNRLWQWHFGAGLVNQPSDFGFNGGQPANSALLDALASDLIRNGWSLKSLHKAIVCSRTYRQSSRSNVEAMKRDADNKRLWRMQPRRLEAEMVRDSMLAVAGSLNLAIGGPGYREFSIDKAEGTPAVLYSSVDQSGPQFRRRTLYRTWARGGRSGFLDAFDCPDPSTTAPKRPVTTTPQQALALLNNNLTFMLADRFAERLKHDVGGDPGKQVDRAFALAFGRSPSPAEREAAIKLIGEHGTALFARAIYNANEFIYVD